MHLTPVVSHVDLDTAFFLAKLHHRTDIIVRYEDRHGIDRFTDFGNLIDGREFARIFHAHDFAVRHQNFVHDGRRRRDEIHVVFALQTFLNDVHVQEPQEPGAETEPQRL